MSLPLNSCTTGDCGQIWTILPPIGGAENAEVENAGVEKAGVMTYGKRLKQNIKSKWSQTVFELCS